MAGPNGSTPVTHNSNDTALKIMSWNGSRGTLTRLLVSHCRLHGTVNILQLFGVQNITVEYSKLYDNDAANSSTYHPNLVEYAGGTETQCGGIMRSGIGRRKVFMIYQSNGGPIYVYGNVWHDATSGYPRIFQPFDNAQGPAIFTTIPFTTCTRWWATGVNGGSLAAGSQSANNIIGRSIGFIGGEPAGADYEYADVSLGEAHSLSGVGQTPFANAAGSDFHIGATISGFCRAIRA